MNDSTKGTNMIEPEWHVEGDWSKATRGSEVMLRNGDGAEATITVSDRLDPYFYPSAIWLSSNSGCTYMEKDWTLFMRLALKAPLPTVSGRYEDANGRLFRIAFGRLALSGLEFLGEQADKLEAPFVRLEPWPDSGPKLRDLVRGMCPMMNMKDLDRIANYFGVGL